MDDTIYEIVSSAMLPISIIIVGVGNADFGSMDVLDSDDERLVDNRGREQVRDNVQFVPYNDCKKDKNLLKNEVLMELPDQIEQYCEYKNIKVDDITSKNKSGLYPIL
mmetsp:Transcript_7431/g.15816  ORF Transcript_7431/g.15816 Transcript_7431/m.15816 type:complete len:108 (+) Transcript_7431:417-740(+)